MSIRNTRTIAAVLVVLAGVTLSADRVRLRSGKTIEGMFLGGDSKTVRLLLDSGQVSEVPLEDAVAVEFSARKPAPPPPAPKPAAAPTRPITSTIHGSGERRRPIAPSRPWTGNGLWASHRVNPASRMRSQAW